MSDDDIDTSDIPELIDEFFERAVWWNRPLATVTLSLDPVMLAWFKSQGPGWEQRIDEVLREYVKTHAGTGGDRTTA